MGTAGVCSFCRPSITKWTTGKEEVGFFFLIIFNHHKNCNPVVFLFNLTCSKFGIDATRSCATCRAGCAGLQQSAGMHGWWVPGGSGPARAVKNTLYISAKLCCVFLSWLKFIWQHFGLTRPSSLASLHPDPRKLCKCTQNVCHSSAPRLCDPP